jgi:hypothetical protein
MSNNCKTENNRKKKDPWKMAANKSPTNNKDTTS